MRAPRSRARRAWAPGAALIGALAAGCGGEGPLPWNGGDGFFDAPWPSDQRTVDGAPDFEGFPGLDDVGLLQDYVAAGEQALDGFGNNAPLYFRFKAPLDASVLPTPWGSTDPSSTVQLVDVDPSSPRRGERIPIRWSWTAEEHTYQPGNLLSLAPVYGYPLRPGTKYAAFVTVGAAQRDPTLAEAWHPEHPEHDQWVDLKETLYQIGLGVEDVAIATVFTTQDPTAEMSDYAWATLELPVQPLDQVLRYVQHLGSTQVWEGKLYLPLWQHGDKPYATEGGGFQRDEGGLPELHSWERTAFSFAFPGAGEPPEAGWPVVLYHHGTGGDHATCCDDTSSLEPAKVLAGAGFAVIGVSQPLHGDRATEDTIPDFHSFNYLNPEAIRCTFRQGALEMVYLSHVLTGRQHVLEIDGEQVPLDPDNVFFMGHSQGGLTGAMAAPFWGERISAAVLSGAGGGLSLTLIERKDPLDIAALVTELLGFDDGEVLDELHPVAGLIQTLAESTDPLNYSPYWFKESAAFSEAPVHVLLTEGMEDPYTPPSTTEALAAAAGIPVLEPVAAQPESHELMGLEPIERPSSGALVGWDGSAITAGLAQYPDQGHYPIFYVDDAGDLYQYFLESAREDGIPTLGY